MSDLDQQDLQNKGVSPDVDAYINYYGFTGDPFSPESALFFTSPQIEKLLRLFNYLARFSRKLVLLTGANGSGKTALLEHFVNEQNEQERVCFFTALNTDTPKQVLAEISEQLKVSNLAGNESPEKLIRAIRDYSLEQLDHDQNCMVVIDDAHLLDQEVLEQLYQLTLNVAEQRCAISLLLCGGGELFTQVQQVVPGDISEKTIFHQQISPLSDSEVTQYLRMHFSENAGQSKPPFSQAEYQAIFEQSEGLPRRVNEAAKQVLAAGMVGLLVSSESVNQKSKIFVGILAVILLMIGGGFFWWQNNDQSPAKEETVNQSMVGQIERSAEEEIPAEIEQAIEGQLFVEPEAEELVAAQDDSIAELGANERAVEDASLVPVVKVNEVKIETKAEVVEVESDELNAEALKPAAEVIAKPEDEQVVESRTVATHSLLETVEEQKPATEVVVPKAEPSTRLAQDAARILAFSSSEYTMQLLGSKKEESIHKIMAKLPDDTNLMYFEKTHKGAPWFVLVYGHYTSRAAANAAAAKMPAALNGIKPWVRGISGVQDTIKAH